MEKEIYFVLGGPGSGKGTFCEQLTSRFPTQVSHFSAGDLLRAFQKSDAKDETNPQRVADLNVVKQCIEEGQIVPAEITTGLLFDAISKGKNPYILVDGFPRNEDNLACWVKLQPKYPNVRVKGMLFLGCR